MSKRFKKVVAVVSAIALFVAGLSIQPQTVSAATALADQTWTNVGVWDLYCGSWGAGALSYEGEGATVDDVTMIIDSSSGASGSWAIQAKLAGYNAGLTAGTVYDMTIKVNTTNAGKILYQVDNVNTTVNVVAGENTITKQITYKGNLADVVFELSGIPTGSEVTFTEVSFKEATEVETTTTTAFVEGEALVDDANVSKPVGAITGGDYWQAEYNNTGLKYVAGKYYVAEVVVSSDVDKKIKMVFQRVGIWDFVDAAEGYEYEIKAGQKVKITYVFEATKDSDDGNFDIYLGSVAAAANLEFESKKLTVYSEVPAGVVTGVEVLSGAEETTVAPEETTVVEETTTVVEETTTVVEETTTVASGDDEYAGLEWTQVGSTDYYVASANNDFPFQMVEDQGTKMLIIPQVAGGTKPIWPDFTDVTLNGEAFDQMPGAGIYIDYASLTMNAYNVYEATSAVDSHRFQIIIKAGNPVGGSEETTVAPEETTVVEETTTVVEETTTVVEETTTVVEETTTVVEETTTVASGDDEYAGLEWTQVGSTDYYVASANNDFPFQMVEDQGTKMLIIPQVAGGTKPIWPDFTDVTLNGEAFDQMPGAGIYIDYAALAMNAYNVYEATSAVDGHRFQIIIKAGNPAGGSEEPTKYSVTVDGTEIAAVEAGETVTLPKDATYGYYIDGAMYKAGATVTVEADMAFTSVNELSVAVANGAGIKVDSADTAGIRFQARVASDNMDAVASDAITEGMLITANDIFEDKGSVMDLTSTYTLKNIVNSGWYNGAVGTYCGSIVKIVESNYIRPFIARAYVTVTYVDGESVTVYSGMSSVRSIAQVADNLIAAGALGQFTAEQQAIINTFAAAN